jgi:Protein of unknown function (DUF3606)
VTRKLKMVLRTTELLHGSRNAQHYLGVISWKIGGIPMPDDKTKVGEPDRSKVAKDQDYEVSYLAHELGISSEQARKLIDRFGGNREKIYAAAETLKQGRQT